MFYYKFHSELFPDPCVWKVMKIGLNCIRAPARHLVALLLFKIFASDKWSDSMGDLIGEQGMRSKPHCVLPGFIVE